MREINDLYASVYLTAMGVSDRLRYLDNREPLVFENALPQSNPAPAPAPVPLLARLKRLWTRAASALRAFEYDPQRTGIGHWWAGL